MTAVAFLSCLPILHWNSQHEWVTFRHVGGQAGVVQQAKAVRWLGPLEYVGGQFALLIGYWFIVWICAMVRFRPGRETDLRILYLWWMSAPTFLLFGAVTLRSGGQLNWPAAAYISGTVLAAAWLIRTLDSASGSFRWWTRFGIVAACIAGVAITIISHETALVRPVVVEIARQIRKNDPFAIRAVDPTVRLRGWKYLGKELDLIRAEVRAQDGFEPVMAAGGWNTAGEVGFYCDRHPRVYSLGPWFGDRHSQYDLWRPNPVADAQVFQGQTFVVVTGHEPTLRLAFAEVSPVREIVYKEGDIPVASWQVWICRGFRGINLPSNGSGRY
jgi:hypothetical protein